MPGDSGRGHRHPLAGHVLSIKELRRWSGAGKDPLYEFLSYFAGNDVVHFFDDFKGDTLSGDDWLVANGGGAGIASYAINVQEDGFIRATTGTGNGDTSTCTIVSPAIYYGDRYSGCMFKWTGITAVTETRIEQGFVDVIPGSTKPIVNVLATPSVNTSVVDAAISVYDHTGTTTTNQLTTIGTSITAAKTTFTPPTAIAATTVNRIRLQLTGATNGALLWMDGILMAQHATGGTSYIEGGSALALVALIRASNATSKSHDIDFIRAWKDRKN